MDLTSDDVARRRSAKRFNEQIKLVAVTANTIGLTLFGSAILFPLVAGVLNRSAVIWIFFAAALHSAAHLALRQLRSED